MLIFRFGYAALHQHSEFLLRVRRDQVKLNVQRTWRSAARSRLGLDFVRPGVL